MTSIRSAMTLLFALTLSLATSAAAQPLSGQEFIPLTPCRVFDSRSGSPLPGGEITNVTITGVCGVPANAVAAALNFTIVGPVAPGHLTVFPTNSAAPDTSVVNYVAGQTVGNAADVKLGADGAISVQPSDSATTNLVVDIYGYFTDVEALAGNNNTALGVGALEFNTTGSGNTALGALALEFNTTGNSNTATGLGALGPNTTGTNNTATGLAALGGNTTGANNTATGLAALSSNTTGVQNTATGQSALLSNATGSSNTAMGNAALQNTTGSGNTAIGAIAGVNVTTGNDNIHIGNNGTSGDNLVIRIGTQGRQTSTSIAGIFGATVFGGAMAVEVDFTGQLGTASSSRRVKDDIRDMDEASGRLGRLRPVIFRYKAEHANGPRQLEYGLIAEEVAEIYPELVVRYTDGQPAGVRYHVLPAMLLNELQRQQREIDELRAQVRALIGGRAAVKE